MFENFNIIIMIVIFMTLFFSILTSSNMACIFSISFIIFLTSFIIYNMGFNVFAFLINIIFVGAITILFLFIIMLINIFLVKSKYGKLINNNYIWNKIPYILFIFAIFTYYSKIYTYDKLKIFDILNTKLFKIEIISEKNYIESLSNFIYNEYYFNILLICIILAIAMIGIINLAKFINYTSINKEINNNKFQNISVQIKRKIK